MDYLVSRLALQRILHLRVRHLVERMTEHHGLMLLLKRIEHHGLMLLLKRIEHHGLMLLLRMIENPV